ncbi:MAG: hypothetical protein IKR75_05900 [Fibrobacter sp.]|jgi:hypothetical protein|uniref:hypothetical protein n=1 Tax=uncultured Fibrobacter sp. TaxID=261512 RepID=UPI0015670AB4|nr:hypothetical protein [uncultured Fibrobacter sp.]MBQ1823969.1 hypothetical protein [Fibrobacter sp.]MBR6317942.1 hypothetical protein [Fibrobacter sp.]
MLNKKNIILIAIGVLLLVIGFICLATGPADNPVSLTVAPLILVVAYVVIIPIGILFKGKKQDK